jgi:hypothetical protein
VPHRPVSRRGPQPSDESRSAPRSLTTRTARPAGRGRAVRRSSVSS